MKHKKIFRLKILAIFLYFACFSCQQDVSPPFASSLQAGSLNGHSLALLIKAMQPPQMPSQDLAALGYLHDSLIGINKMRHRLELLTGSEEVLPALAAVNECGDVLAWEKGQDESLWVLCLEKDKPEVITLIQVSWREGKILSQFFIEVPKLVPLSDGIHLKYKSREVFLDYNRESLDTQLLQLDASHLLLRLWNGLIPLVMLFNVRDGSLEDHKYLLPFPEPHENAPLIPILPSRLEVQNNGKRLWIYMQVDAQHLYYLPPFLESFQKGVSAMPISQTIVWSYRHQDFNLNMLPPQKDVAKLWVDESDHVHRVLVNSDGVQLSKILPSGEEKIEIAIKDSIFANSYIHDLYYDHHTLWLAGELGLQQMPTGSIVSATQAFLLRWNLKTGKHSLWLGGNQHRNYMRKILSRRNGLEFLFYENIPLTHHESEATGRWILVEYLSEVKYE